MSGNYDPAVLATISEYWNTSKEDPKWPSEAVSLVSIFRERASLESNDVSIEDRYLNAAHVTLQWEGQDVHFVGAPGFEEVVTEETDAFELTLGELGMDNTDLCLLMVSDDSPDEVSSVLSKYREQGWNLLLTTPSDIDALANGQWNIEDLLLYKLSKVIIGGYQDSEAIYETDSYARFTENIGDFSGEDTSLDIRSALEKRDDGKHPRQLITHPLEDQLISRIEADGNTTGFISGASSSGKTSLGLRIGYQLVSSTEWEGEILFLDISTVSEPDLINLCIELFQIRESEKDVTIFADDMQSNPEITRQLLSFLEFVRNSDGQSSFDFVGLTWPEFWAELEPDLDTNDYFHHRISPEQVRRALINRFADKISSGQIERAKEIAADDLLVLETVLRWLADTSEEFTEADLESEFARTIWEQEIRDPTPIETDVLKQVILLTSCLGRYEIAVDDQFLVRNSDAEPDDISKLIESKVLRRKGEKLSLGHRSYCDLLFSHVSSDGNLWNWFDQNRGLTDASDIVLDYLYSLTPSKIWPILKSIHTHAGLDVGEDLSERGELLINTWKNIDYLAGKVIVQQSKDPSWNKTPSSAQFAVQSLCAIGQYEEAKESIQFLRSLYTVGRDRDSFDVDIERLSTVKDFELIKDRMVEEDEAGDPVAESGANVDPDRFHRNWVRGVILCAEAYYGELSGSELQELAKCVETHVEEPGYFYPARVPWGTARVLIGLGLCGRTVENSETVRSVVDWLLNHPSYDEGRWESGTGTWNTWIETTALSLNALIQAGVDPEHEKIKAGVQALFQARDKWLEDGKRLDGVIALEAYSLSGGDLHAVVDEVATLSDWARDNALWINATRDADEIFDQSCLVAQTTAGLITSMWEYLRSDLPSLLRHFDIQSGHRVQTTDRPECFISYSWHSEEHRDWVRQFALDLESEGFEVNFDQSRSSTDDIPQYMERAIEDADCVVLVCTPEYARKANEREGGVGYETSIITAKMFRKFDSVSFIPVLSRGNIYEALPTYVSSKQAIDFRDQSEYQKRMNRLARTIEEKTRDKDE